jgi:hypothetical protein
MECDTILPGFKSRCGGINKYSKTDPKDEELLAAAYRVQENCKAGAILINHFDRKKD